MAHESLSIGKAAHDKLEKNSASCAKALLPIAQNFSNC